MIIPVLNEESMIVTVIESLKQWNLTRIRVADNSPIDNSVAKSKQACAEVIIKPQPAYA